MSMFCGRRRRSSAGLFMSDGIMQYVSIDVSHGRKLSFGMRVEVPLERYGDDTDMLADRDVLEHNLKKLKRAVGGKWADEVCVGVRPKDVMLRTVAMPNMSVEDARDAFRFEFDRFFTMPVRDAVYDLAPIDYPSVDSTTMHYIAAAAKAKSMENLFLTAANLSMKLVAVEPGPLAAHRCIMGVVRHVGCNLCIVAGANGSMIIASYNDNGVIYRNTAHSFASERLSKENVTDLARDVLSTMNFAASQLRSFDVDAVYLGGYGARFDEEFKRDVADATSVPVVIVDPWVAWNVENAPDDKFGLETSLGLALRNR